MSWFGKKFNPQRGLKPSVRCPDHRAEALFTREEVIGGKALLVYSHEYEDRGAAALTTCSSLGMVLST